MACCCDKIQHEYRELDEEHNPSRRGSLLVHTLAVLFGISSWVEICGLSVQLPLMVETLPEGWLIPSYIVVLTQVANIGPLVYSIVRKYWSHEVLEVPAIHITLGIAFTSCLLLAFLWDRTTYIGGYNHSTALFILCFFLALVDCTSSVLYLPFMARFQEIYVISCMIGEGMSGFFPSIVGLIQGVGGNLPCQNITEIDNNVTVHTLVPAVPKPLFSIGVYFIFLCLMIVASYSAFLMLLKLPAAQKERVCETRIPDSNNDCNNEENNESHTISNENQSLKFYATESLTQDDRTYTKSDMIILLSIQTYVCVMQNGILSSIQSFSCLPYGNMAYHLSVNFSMISNPIACFIAVFLPAWCVRSVVLWTIFGSVWGVYILAVAILSPFPPFVDTTFGVVLIIFSWTIFVGSVSYVKACIAGILRRSGGNRALFWGGALSQVGSCFGGVFMFVIVNFTKLFQAGSSC